MRSHLRREGKVDRDEWRTMNAKHMLAYRPHWPWTKFSGSDACLKWSFRDLQNLDAALSLSRRRRVAVQAGGNLGLFPKRLAEEFDVVYTFEPDPELFVCMTRNAPEKNIVRMQAALGCSRNGVSVAGHRRDKSGRPAHEGLTHVSGPGKIPQIVLDDLQLRDVDLIYLDIEGYEMDALVGAKSTIMSCMPIIVVEINSNCLHYNVKPEQLREFITMMGYERRVSMNSDEVYVPL